MSEEQNRERYAADLAYEHDLSLPQGRKLAELAISALDPTLAPAAALHLADPAVTEAYLWAPLGPYADDDSVAKLDELALRAVEAGHETAGAWFARARVAEHRGDLDAQRAHLEASVGQDPEFGPALADLGFIAFVDGDAARSGRLLQASGDPRCDRMVHTLTHYGRDRSPVGRNERCPCGSGRKHKHCCAGDPSHPLPHRAMWLWEKAGTWLRRPPQHGPLIDVACRLVGVADPDDDENAVFTVLQTPALESVALLDAGLLRRFITRLGPLLPDDERELAEQWTGIRHRAWRVADVRPGSSLVLSDLVGGQTLEAVNGAVSRCTQPGELVFAAVVPTGGGWQLPCHPVGLAPGSADAVAALLRSASDPLSIAATVVRGIRNATM